MNFSENFIVIASRKADFVEKFIERLKEERELSMTPKDISEIAETVAKLDPLLFLSLKEKNEGHLYFGTSMEDLDREKIAEEIYKKLNIEEDI